jgi:hypothetical protein
MAARSAASSTRESASIGSSRRQSAADMRLNHALRDDRVGNEGEGPPAEGLLNERRIDIGDAVAEAAIAARGAVMQLVRMKDVRFAGKAVPLLAAVPERLDSRKGDADRIGVVAMRRKGPAGEVRLEALDAVGSEADRNSAFAFGGTLERAVAQAFKTAFAVGP